MKNQARVLCIGIALVAAAAVCAQGKRVSANVPFNFYVGSSLMPQGAYQFEEISNRAAALITSRETGAAKGGVATYDVVGNKLDEPARLVFRCYGDECFLAEIWSGGGPTGSALARSPQEKELMQSKAARTLSVIQIALHR
jgi:hypothetical protein